MSSSSNGVRTLRTLPHEIMFGVLGGLEVDLWRGALVGWLVVE